MIPVLIKIKKWYSIIDFIIKMLYNIIGGDKMKLFKRENYLSKIRGFYHTNDIIKVITGIRRCGKSSLMQMIADEIIESGVNKENIIYINLDKKGFKNIKKTDELENLIDSLSNVKGNKYSLISEAIYEKQWEKIKLTAGAKYTHQWVDNTYYIDNTAQPVSMTTSETYLFAEMQHRVGKFSYTLGLGVMNTLLNQSNTKQSSWIARPQLTLNYDIGFCPY